MTREAYTPSVDFHVHYSDFTAERIIDGAKKKRVSTIALIGRGEISDYFSNFIDYGKQRGVTVLPGVECVAKINGQRTDLVAIGFDYNAPLIRRYFGKEEGRQDNATIAKKQMDFLSSNGFEFEELLEPDIELLQSLLRGDVTEKAIRFCQIAVRCEKNKKRLDQLKDENGEEWTEVQEKYQDRPGYKDMPSTIEAKFLWSHYFAIGKPGCFPIHKKAEEIIKAVHDAQGVILYSPEGKFDQLVWDKLLDDSVDGIMLWHGQNIEVERSVILQLREKGLLALGGSDYDPYKEHWQVGNGAGNMYISPRRYQEYLNYKSRKYGS